MSERTGGNRSAGENEEKAFSSRAKNADVARRALARTPVQQPEQYDAEVRQVKKPAQRLRDLSCRGIRSMRDSVLKDLVIPARLLDAGFRFDFADWRSAAAELAQQRLMYRSALSHSA